MNTVFTNAGIWSLDGVGSRCVLGNNHATYPGSILLGRWRFRINAGADTQRAVFLGCRSVIVMLTCGPL